MSHWPPISDFPEPLLQEKTYAPVVRIDSVRTIFAIVAYFDLHMIRKQLSLTASATLTSICGRSLALLMSVPLIKSFALIALSMALNRHVASGTSFYVKLLSNMDFINSNWMNAFLYRHTIILYVDDVLIIP